MAFLAKYPLRRKKRQALTGLSAVHTHTVDAEPLRTLSVTRIELICVYFYLTNK